MRTEIESKGDASGWRSQDFKTTEINNTQLHVLPAENPRVGWHIKDQFHLLLSNSKECTVDFSHDQTACRRVLFV